MYEIKNRTSGPVQLIIRSKNSHSPLVERKHSAALACLNIPGLQKICVEDERIIDKYLKQNVSWGLLSYKKVA